MDVLPVSAWPVRRLIGYALLPGLVGLLVFLPLAYLLEGVAPAMVALFLGILLGEVPTSWWLMIRSLKREGHDVSFANLFPWRASVGWLRLLAVGLPLVLVSMVFVFGMASAAEPTIRGTLFAWVPAWAVPASGPAALTHTTRGGLLAMWILSLVVGAGIGGITQEAYHRGFLLPRAAHLGWWAVPFNGLFFAIMHFAAPWGWPFFFLAGTLWAAAVYRWRALQLGLIGHVGMLLLGWLLMTLIVFGVVPVPG